MLIEIKKDDLEVDPYLTFGNSILQLQFRENKIIFDKRSKTKLFGYGEDYKDNAKWLFSKWYQLKDIGYLDRFTENKNHTNKIIQVF